MKTTHGNDKNRLMVCSQKDLFATQINKGTHEGWVVPANRQETTIQDLVTALDADEPPISDGLNARAVLEIAIALRESYRNGHTPIRLPLTDRNLRVIPKRTRLQYKKPLRGREWYLRELCQRLG